MKFIEKIKCFMLAVKKANSEINRDRNEAKRNIECMENFLSDLDGLRTDMIDMHNLLAYHIDLLLDGEIKNSWKDTYNILKNGYCVSENGNAFVSYRAKEPYDESHTIKEYISGIYYEIGNMITDTKVNLGICKDYFKKMEYDNVEKQFCKFIRDVDYRTEYSRIDFKKICEKTIGLTEEER